MLGALPQRLGSAQAAATTAHDVVQSGRGAATDGTRCPVLNSNPTVHPCDQAFPVCCQRSLFAPWNSAEYSLEERGEQQSIDANAAAAVEHPRQMLFHPQRLPSARRAHT